MATACPITWSCRTARIRTAASSGISRKACRTRSSRRAWPRSIPAERTRTCRSGSCVRTVPRDARRGDPRAPAHLARSVDLHRRGLLLHGDRIRCRGRRRSHGQLGQPRLRKPRRKRRRESLDAVVSRRRRDAPGSSSCSTCCRIRTRSRQAPPCDICVPAAGRRSRRSTTLPANSRTTIEVAGEDPGSRTRTSPRRSPRPGRSSPSARCI